MDFNALWSRASAAASIGCHRGTDVSAVVAIIRRACSGAGGAVPGL